MTPEQIQALIMALPQVIAQVIAILKLLGRGQAAEELAVILRRSDANADQLIANAQAALTPPG